MSHRAPIVLAGGSGFLGKILTRWMLRRGQDVIVLTRRPGTILSPARQVIWNGTTLGPWRTAIDGASAVINLAGRSVNCRYTERNRRAILGSRIDSTRVLAEAIESSKNPPSVWFNSSTATIYKHAFDHPMTESSGAIGATREAKDEFSVKVARAWEEAFFRVALPHTRRVALRTAMVFGLEPGTVYQILRRLARWGLGGPMAGGRQYVSWIHETDFCRAVEWLLRHNDLQGVVNLTAPHPLSNGEMMQEIRQACHRRMGFPATRGMLEVGAVFLRTETELIIKSRRVVPERLLNSGFAFRYPRLGLALEELESRRTTRVEPDALDLSTSCGCAT